MNNLNPTEKNQGWTRFFTFPNVCIGLGLLLLYQEKTLLGVGFVLSGLILRLERMIRNPEKKEVRGDKRPVSGSDEESRSFGFNLTRPKQALDSGWSTASIFPAQHRYQRSDCYGGPPVTEELWEYDIKERSAVFQRLLDRYDVNFEGPEYEVVNGNVLEDVFERKRSEREIWLNSLPEEKREFYGSNSPYSTERLTELRREVLWFELHGAMKYFILSKHYPHGEWKKELEKLRASFSKIATEAETLGARVDEYGFYKLPKEAGDIERQKLNDLFSETTLLKKYRIHSFGDWRDRDLITKLLDEGVDKGTGHNGTEAHAHG
jgi:hypothetical protein